MAAAMANINHLAIVAAAVAAWVFGAIYYGILGKVWLAAQGKTMESCKVENAGKSTLAKAFPFVLSFVAEMVMAWALYGILLHMGLLTVRGGIIAAALCWLGFVLTTIAVNNAYSMRKPMLTLIDAGHWLGALLVIGTIVGWLGT